MKNYLLLAGLLGLASVGQAQQAPMTPNAMLGGVPRPGHDHGAIYLNWS